MAEVQEVELRFLDRLHHLYPRRRLDRYSLVLAPWFEHCDVCGGNNMDGGVRCNGDIYELLGLSALP